MSCSRPVAPQSSISSLESPLRSAYARIPASTAWQWRRSDGDSTHSVSRAQAVSRETGEVMLGTLAAPSLMEKFVIQGGVPLSGTVVPAGNKNGALPILAASVLTD